MLTGSPNYTAKKTCPRTDAARTASSKLFANTPSADGGYALLGLRGPCAPLFQDIAWSTEAVREQTLERAREAGLSIHGFEPCHVVDTPEELEKPRRGLASATGLLTRTAEILRRR